MFTKLGSKNTFSVADINGYVKNNNLCVNIKYTFTDLTYNFVIAEEISYIVFKICPKLTVHMIGWYAC